MEDRKRKLEALAKKQRDTGVEAPKSTAKSTSGAGGEKSASTREAALEREERDMERRGVKLDEYQHDGFVVSDNDESEDESEDASEAFSDEDDSDDEVRRPKKKAAKTAAPAKKASGSSSKAAKPAKKQPKKKAADSDESASGSESGDDVDDELEGLDTSAIITTGRRTRGARIDYRQFGMDKPEDDE